jgi:hypothetical protein
MNILSNYRKMLEFIDEKAHGMKTTASDRNATAGSLYDVAHEHAKGICTLLENHHYASAYALIRSLFETFVRAAWILHCATDSEVSTFVNDDKIELDSKEKFYFGDMIESVEEVKNWPNTLSGIKVHAWKALNSYTHGGQFQITRRYNGATIEPHHDSEQMDEVCRFSAMIAFLTFAEMVGMSDDPELDISSEVLYEQIRPWCYNKAI